MPGSNRPCDSASRCEQARSTFSASATARLFRMMPFRISRVLFGASLAAAPLFAAEESPAFADILKIDAHSHVFGDLPDLNAYMRAANIRTINICNRGTEDHVEIMHRVAAELYRNEPTLYPYLSTFDLHRRDDCDEHRLHAVELGF